ncbi:hypothetical protein ElyMa_003709700 [Elysia marginata]|uniref:Uncharacterized protein n=1 Tax=Elysia marginata TaxID=1093978 RepID=A0AAV4F2E1_9GAST|nr:hypothetical protein ElyMa_003709700 [Elysia marginata]
MDMKRGWRHHWSFLTAIKTRKSLERAENWESICAAAERQRQDTNRSNRNAYTCMNPWARNGSGTVPADLRYRGGNFLITPRTDFDAAAEVQ